MNKRLVYGSNGKLHLVVWNLACILRTYRTCNSNVGFSKYEFNNKLLSGVTLFRVTPGVTWTQPYIYIYIYNLGLFILDSSFFYTELIHLAQIFFLKKKKIR